MDGFTFRYFISYILIWEFLFDQIGNTLLYTYIDPTLVNSLHWLLNCKIGWLDCHVITTEYRTRVIVYTCGNKPSDLFCSVSPSLKCIDTCFFIRKYLVNVLIQYQTLDQVNSGQGQTNTNHNMMMVGLLQIGSV